MRPWNEQAVAMYATGYGVSEIAQRVGRSRQTVSAYLHLVPGWKRLQRDHRAARKKQRLDYQREWDRTRRQRPSKEQVPYDAVKRQHETDVRVLSMEVRYQRDE